jgi:hypothetical protein
MVEERVLRRERASRMLAGEGQMSSEERQRILRRAGSTPAEAEKQERAKSSRKAKRVEDARIESEQEASGENPTPLPEGPEDPPRPRR